MLDLFYINQWRKYFQKHAYGCVELYYLICQVKIKHKHIHTHTFKKDLCISTLIILQERR